MVSTDFSENSAEDISDYEFTVVGGELTSTLPPGWNLWSSPLVFEDSLHIQITDDYTSPFWFYNWDGFGHNNDDILNGGDGLWLGFIEDVSFTITGEPFTEATTIAYPQGWNIISNPLVRDITRTELTVTFGEETISIDSAIVEGWITEPLYAYNGTEYTVAEELTLWDAYWLGVVEGGVSVNYIPHEVIEERQEMRIEYAWQLTINDLVFAGYELSENEWDINE